MRFHKILWLVLVVATMAVAQDAGPGQPPQQIVSRDQTREFTERFLGKLVSSPRVYDAFAILKAAAPDADTDLDNVRRDAEGLFEEIRPLYGRVIGYDGLDSKMLGQSFVRYDYLLKFEHNAIHFRIIYYKPHQTWVPVLMLFTRDLDDAWDALAK